MFKIKYLRLLLAALLCLICTAARADFTFVAFGDTPYTEEEEGRFVGMIAEINREKSAFVIHVGDFKNGWSPCTDALFNQRREWFTLFHQALIYTPGDNEWTDCRRALGGAHDPLERLQKLRSLFFTDTYSLGQQKIALSRQGGYPENARWIHEGLLFVTLNVTGSNNNMNMPAEFAAREQATLLWLSETFNLARKQGNRAVVLAMQANPFVVSSSQKNGFASLLQALRAEAARFDGEILLIHGDTHHYRFDKPLTDLQTKRQLRNVTRLEVFGYPFMNWVRVRVSQRNGQITFSASPGDKPPAN